MVSTAPEHALDLMYYHLTAKTKTAGPINRESNMDEIKLSLYKSVILIIIIKIGS